MQIIVTMPFVKRTVSLAALFFLVSCFGESTGPEFRRGRLAVTPHFASPHAARLVEVSRVRIVLLRPGETVPALDTVVVFPPGSDTLSLELEVPVNGTSETFNLALAMINAAGDTVFRAGPVPVTASSNALNPAVTAPPLRYTGVGFDAAGVRFVSPPVAAFFGQTVPLVAEAFDSSGAALPGTPVVFELVNPGDSVRARIPDPDVGQLVAGAQRGAVPVRALLLTQQSAQHTVAIQPVPNAIAIQAGNSQSGPVGQALTQQLVARVNAADNLGVQGVVVSFAVTAGGGMLSATSDTTDANGDASVTWTLGTQIGAQAASATAAGITGGTVTFSATGTPGAATRLAFVAEPTALTPGSVFNPVVTVGATDAFGNATPLTGQVTVTLIDPGGTGTLTGSTTATASGGIATFTGLGLTGFGTGFMLQATHATLAPDTSAAFATTIGPPALLVVQAQPTNAVAGSPISPAVTVLVRDAAGTTVPTATNDVTVSLGANPGGATLGGTLTVAAVNGVATFSDLSLDKAAAGYTLQVAGTGLTGATSAPFDVTPGAAQTLGFGTTPPASVTAGAPIVVSVEARDALGNLATGFTGPVTLALGTNPAGGTLSGTLTVNAVAGVATFADPALDLVGTGYTLAATAGGLVAATSGTFDVAPAAAAALSIAQGPPATTEAGLPIAPGLVVEVRDAFGNLATGFGGTVSVALLANPGPATLSGTLGVAASAGVATFSDLRLNRAAAGYTLEFSATGLPAIQTGAFTVDPGPAAQLVFATQPPANTLYGAPFAASVVAQDSLGNVATGFTGSVTVALGANPAGGTLAGTLTVNATAGVANFSGLSIDNIGGPYSLAAAAPGLAPGASGNITVAAPATVHAWVNVAGGNWNVPANWSQGVVPGPTDTIEIRQSGTYTVVVNSAVTIAGRLDVGGGAGTQTLAIQNTFAADSAVVIGVNGRLLVSGGTLTGVGQVEVFGRFEWTGGNVSGAVAGAGTVVRAGGQLEIGGVAARTFTNYVLENQGTGLWSGAGVLNSGSDATIRNAPGATFAWNAAAQFLFNQGGAASRFDNQGTFTAAPGGTAIISAVFDNAGTAAVTSGTLQLNGGGTGTGQYSAAAGTLLSFGGGTHTLQPGSLVSGAGEVRIVAGTVNAAGDWNVTSPTSLAGGTFNYNQAAGGTTSTFDMSGGTLGGSGLFRVSGAMTWTGGSLSGGGGTTRVLAGATLTIAGAALRNLVDYTLEVGGAGTWTGAHNINAGSAGTIRVLTGGTLDIQGDPSFLDNQGGANPILDVQGTLVRSTSAGTATITAQLDNSGQVQVASGVLASGGGTSVAATGSYDVAAGARLGFTGGTHTLGATATVAGAGVVRVSAGTVHSDAAFSVTGATEVTGGILNYNAASGTTAALLVSAGTLGGNTGGLLAVTGTADWTGGNLQGNGGTTRVDGALTLSGTATRTFTNYTLAVAGTGVWNGTHSINAGSAATIRVLAGGTLDIQADPSFLDNQGGANPILDVQGTLLRSTSAGTATVTAQLDNSGQVQVASGVLASGGGTSVAATGSYDVAAGARLSFTGGTHTLGAAATVAGAGVVRVSAGTVHSDAAFSVTGATEVTGGILNYNAASGTTAALLVSAGTLGGNTGGLLAVTGTADWTGGNLQGNGGTTRVDGALTLSGTATRTFTNYTLAVAGTGVWNGTHSINAGSAATIRVLPGGTLDIQADPSFLDNQGGANPILDVQGTLLRSTSAGTATVTAQLDNSGQVQVASGVLASGGGTSVAATGSYAASAGARLDFTAGVHALGASATVTGAGVVRVSGGTVNSDAFFSVSGATEVTGGILNYNAASGTTAALLVAAGTLGGNTGGLLAVTGTADWTGGSLQGNGGTTRVDGALTISGTATRTFTNYTLALAGSGAWNGSHNLNSGSGATIRVLPGATLDISADPQFLDNQGGANPLFENQGSVTRSTSAGIVVVGVPFNNAGTVDIQSGIVRLTAGGALDGAVTVGSSASLDLTGGIITLVDGLQVLGAGFTNIQGATVAGLLPGETAVFNALHLQGGSLQHGAGGTVRTDVVFHWSGGTLTGGGTTVVVDTAAAIFSTTASRTLLTHTVDVFGTAAWAGDFNMNSGSGGTIRIRPGASLSFGALTGNSGFLDNQGGATPVLMIEGAMVIPNGAIFSVSGDFQMSGTLDVAVGVLSLTGPSTWTGSATSGAGGLIQFDAGTAMLGAGASFGGVGDVVLSGGTLDGAVGNTATFERLHLLTGTFTHDGLVSVTSDLRWVDATAITNAGTLRLEAGGSFVLAGTAGRTFAAATLEIGGNGTWSGTFNINAGSGAVLRVLSGGLLDMQTDGGYLDNQGGAAPRLVNEGTLANNGSGIVTITAELIDTTGTFALNSGTVEAGGGGRLGGSGLLLGGILDLTANTMSLKAGMSASSAGGVMRLSGGTLTVDSISLVLPAFVPRLDQVGGTLAHEGRLNLSAFNWDAGTVSSNTSGLGGTTHILTGGSFVINTAASKTHVGAHTIDNNGTGIFAGTGNINTGNDAEIRIGTTGSFDWQGDAAIVDNQGGAAPRFINTGFLQRSTSVNPATMGSFYVDTASSGFQVSSGRFVIQNGGRIGGSPFVAAGAFLDVGNAATTSIKGSTTFGGLGRVVLTGGTLTIDTASIVTIPRFDHTGGTVDHKGTLVISTDWTWTTGTYLTNTTGGQGVTRIQGTGTISGPGSKVIVGPHQLQNVGSVVYAAGAQNIGTGQGASVRNQGTWDWQGDGQIIVNQGGGATWENFSPGILRRSVSANPAVLQLVMNQDNGTFDIQTGSLRLTGGSINFRGTFNAAPGAFLDLGAGSYQPNNFTGSTFTGDLRISGTGLFIVQPDSTTTVTGQLSTTGGGRVQMTTGSQIQTSLVVGSASFGGGSTQTLLTVGTMSVSGDFAQVAGGSAFAFAPSGTFRTFLSGAGTQNISFANPTQSAFHRLVTNNSGSSRDLVLQTDVTVNDSLIANGGANFIGAGATQRMRVNGFLRLVSSTVAGRVAPPVLELAQFPSIDSSVFAPRGLQADTTVFIGSLTTLPWASSITYNHIRIATTGTIGTFSANGSQTIAGDLVISSGTLNWNTSDQLNVQKLRTLGTGALQQSTFNIINVADSAIFAGGSTAGLLTNGFLRLQGHFVQAGPTGASFQGSAGHTTVFRNTVGRRTISFANPGTSAATSRFGTVSLDGGGAPVAVELLGNVNAEAVQDVAAGAADTVIGGNFRITTNGLTANNTIFNAAPVTLNGAGASGGSGIQFLNMDPDTDHLVINRGGNLSFTNVTFATAPNPGFFNLRANSTAAAGPPSWTFLTSSPAAATMTGPPARYIRTGALLPILSWNGVTLP